MELTNKELDALNELFNAEIDRIIKIRADIIEQQGEGKATKKLAEKLITLRGIADKVALNYSYK
tara:strand:- start:221 stop:412 length:192 start_codon:yes stop_codon:yes gene_type:complete